MPGATETGADAFINVERGLPALRDVPNARDAEVGFLRDHFQGNHQILFHLIQCHEILDNFRYFPVQQQTIPDVRELIDTLYEVESQYPECQELRQILTQPHIKSVFMAHDSIATKEYDQAEQAMLRSSFPPGFAMTPTDTIRMVGIRKTEDEPLGITVKVNDNGELEIARIMQGGMIDRQGLLHVGDVIKEINGEEVFTPEDLQEKIRVAKGSITLKVLPSLYDIPHESQVFVKAHFTYDPLKDNLIPSKEAGLPFSEGDILQILNKEDRHWWQAILYRDRHRKGLIPSAYLEERRKAFVKPEEDLAKTSWACGLIDRRRKRRMMYSTSRHADLDRADIRCYEEVARMPPFQRKTLVLIGANGVGRRTLKTKLMNLDPDRFATTIPHTTREMRDSEETGRGYFFTDRPTMEQEISQGEFLEWGEFNGNLYGTKFETMRQVVRSGKMCILDINPSALKLLDSADFMPFVVFVKSPSLDQLKILHHEESSKTENGFKSVQGKKKYNSMANLADRDLQSIVDESEEIERVYHSYFDLVLVNDNMERTFKSLFEAIECMSAEPQWTPVAWVY